MHRVATAVLAAGVLAGTARAQMAKAVPFEVVIERVDSTWKAHCTKGCSWSQSTQFCAKNCRLELTDLGFGKQSSGPEGSAKFRMELEPTDAGWRARAWAGTVWRSLPWSCREKPCVAKITEQGVGPA